MAPGNTVAYPLLSVPVMNSKCQQELRWPPHLITRLSPFTTEVSTSHSCRLRAVLAICLYTRAQATTQHPNHSCHHPGTLTNHGRAMYQVQTAPQNPRWHRKWTRPKLAIDREDVRWEWGTMDPRVSNDLPPSLSLVIYVSIIVTHRSSFME